ncbi:MAG: L-lactate dehydrogenase [Clostridia bacterium]|nr:L-lactate dehydrogenase [Clostridia bacterium]
MIEKRKLVIIGTGFVGMSTAYALVCNRSSGVNEIVLIDIQKDKAIGEAMDLSHGLPCSGSHMSIKAGDYHDCRDADLVLITAGINQKPGQTRLDLSVQNAVILKEITENVVKSGFSGIFLVATNPVDIMTKLVKDVSNFPPSKVIGSGTALDTARLRYLLSEYLNVSSNNIHAYIMGEHGDSSFPVWEHAYVGCKRILDIVPNTSALDALYLSVRDAAYEIINKKKATYYGIGLGLAKIVRTIMNDTNEILTVSSYLNNKYGENDIYLGVPTVLNSYGARELLELNLTKQEQLQFSTSANIIRENYNKIEK